MGRSSALHLVAGALLLALLARSAVLGFPRAQQPQSALVAGPDAPGNVTEPLGSSSIAYRLYSILRDEDLSALNDTCGQDVQATYHCAEPSCDDLTAGEQKKWARPILLRPEARPPWPPRASPSSARTCPGRGYSMRMRRPTRTPLRPTPVLT